MSIVDSQAERTLKIGELYDAILSLIPDEQITKAGGQGAVLGKLDAILTVGKIEGRLTGLKQIQPTPKQDETWIDRSNDGKTVVIRSISPARIVHYADPNCPCGAPWHAHTGHEASLPAERFTERFRPSEDEDQLIERWLRIMEAAA